MTTSPAAAASACGAAVAGGRVDAAGGGRRTGAAACVGCGGAHLAVEFFRAATRTHRLFTPANQKLAVVLAFLTIIFVNGH